MNILDMSKPSLEFLSSAIYLVDASSFIFRAYYGIRQPLTAPDGTPTHATFAFLQMIESLVSSQAIERIALIWDRKEKGFRHEIYPQYKANRDAPPEDLSLQIENSQKIMDPLGYPQYSCQGFEADDLIATAVAQHPNQNFVVVTADKDLLQLVGPHVWCLDTMKKKWSNQDECVEKFGVQAHQVTQIQALCGDSSDNIPGAPSIGPKTATQLINHFGSLENVLAEAKNRYDNPEDFKKINDPLKGKKIEAIATHIEQILMSLKLVSLSTQAPLPKELSAYNKLKVDNEKLHDIASKLGFTKLLEKSNLHHQTTQTQRETKKSDIKFILIDSLEKLKTCFNAHLELIGI